MEDGNGSGLGVLVADDEEWVLRLVEVALRAEKMRVCLARCGKEAVELLQRLGDAIDVALLDVRMPGLTGPEALGRMRALRPGLPCVFMTGHVGAEAEPDLRAADCHVLPKPFGLDDLARVVRQAAAG
jgi:DNA-binding NtrC family response regulator